MIQQLSNFQLIGQFSIWAIFNLGHFQFGPFSIWAIFNLGNIQFRQLSMLANYNGGNFQFIKTIDLYQEIKQNFFNCIPKKNKNLSIVWILQSKTDHSLFKR